MVVNYKILAILLVLYNNIPLQLIYFICSSLCLFIPYTCVAPAPIPLPAGDHQFFLCICGPASFLLFSVVCFPRSPLIYILCLWICLFWTLHINGIVQSVFVSGFFFFFNIYLFPCARSWLPHVGSSSLTRDWPRASALGAWSLSRWTTKEALCLASFSWHHAFQGHLCCGLCQCSVPFCGQVIFCCVDILQRA